MVSAMTNVVAMKAGALDDEALQVALTVDELRNYRRFSHVQFGEALGVSRQTVHNWCAGRYWWWLRWRWPPCSSSIPF